MNTPKPHGNTGKRRGGRANKPKPQLESSGEVHLSPDELAAFEAMVNDSPQLMIGMPQEVAWVCCYALSMLRHFPTVDGFVKDTADGAFELFGFIMADAQPELAQMIAHMDAWFLLQGRQGRGD